MKHIMYLIAILFAFSCKQEAVKAKDIVPVIAKQSIDDLLADNLVSAFKKNIFAEDMIFLEKDTTAFQFYKIDLDGDSEEEVFIRFMSPYFCGTGGCTFLIVNQKFEVLNRFTTTRAPIIASSETQNGWRVLLTAIEGEMKMLINKNGRYPSNPSMALKSDIQISLDDTYMFDDEKSPSKTYHF